MLASHTYLKLHLIIICSVVAVERGEVTPDLLILRFYGQLSHVYANGLIL